MLWVRTDMSSLELKGSHPLRSDMPQVSFNTLCAVYEIECMSIRTGHSAPRLGIALAATFMATVWGIGASPIAMDDFRGIFPGFWGCMVASSFCEYNYSQNPGYGLKSGFRRVSVRNASYQTCFN